MKPMAREFTTTEGRRIELVGPSHKVQVWIDGKLYTTVSGLHFARRVALDHSKRHGPK